MAKSLFWGTTKELHQDVVSLTSLQDVCNPLVHSVINHVNVFNNAPCFLPTPQSWSIHRKEMKKFIRSTKGLNITKLKINKNEYTYRVIQEESALLWEMIVWVILSKKVHTNMGPILNGYGVMGIF